MSVPPKRSWYNNDGQYKQALDEQYYEQNKKYYNDLLDETINTSNSNTSYSSSGNSSSGNSSSGNGDLFLSWGFLLIFVGLFIPFLLPWGVGMVALRLAYAILVLIFQLGWAIILIPFKILKFGLEIVLIPFKILIGIIKFFFSK